MTTPQLKDLIQDKHNEAENHRFAKYLFNKEIGLKVYADYLYNQYLIYNALENRVKQEGILEGLDDIYRAQNIFNDFKEIQINDVKKYLATIEYEKYIRDCDKDDLLAHIYVRHFGDMYGGSILKKNVPGSGTMYDFDNKKELISIIREMLTAEMATEANKVFQFAIDLFEELSNEHNI